MVKVLHVVLSLNVGGLETFLVSLIKNYSDQVAPYVVCLEGEGALAPLVEGKLLALNEKPGRKLQAAGRIARLAREKAIDVIHTHNECAHLYGSLAGLMAKVPVVHTRHGRYLHDSRKTLLLDTLSSFISSKVVGVSEDVSQMMKRQERIPAGKVLTILNGVDVDAYSPGHCEAEGGAAAAAAASPVRLGTVARLHAVKDHSTLLQACAILRKHTEDFEVLLVGDGPMRAQLERETAELGLRDCTTFTGTRYDVAEALKEMDIFVLPSTSEGISMTLLEAMSCSLPVVATDVGGNCEVVVDGETGFLVPPKEPALLAEKLLALVKSKPLRRAMGQAGYARVAAHFSISRCAREYEHLYQQVMGRQG